MINLHDASLTSWVAVAPQSDFPIQNLPFGIFSTEHKQPRVCTRIGDYVLDLAVLGKFGYFNEIDFDESTLSEPSLNRFIGLGKKTTHAVRLRLAELLLQTNHELQSDHAAVELALLPMDEVQLHLPVKVGDYTDFYSSREHATNVGTMFRDPDNALLPNWLHLPVGYHGRSSSIVISGTPIHRPKGQQNPTDAPQPIFGASKLLDFELEMAFIIGKPTEMGESIAVAEAEDYIFGMVLFNDWSARDIQKWEYVPLGPFLSKNFASSISPWVVTMEALDFFRTEGPTQEPAVLPYLQFDGKKNYDIHLSAAIATESGIEKTICQTNFKYMYWNMAQQLAHHTINGCNVQVGDMCASGTISGSTPDSYGSLLEITWRGSKPIEMPDGTERKFLQDGDTLVMRGYCEKDGLRIGFGEVSGKILPTA